VIPSVYLFVSALNTVAVGIKADDAMKEQKETQSPFVYISI